MARSAKQRTPSPTRAALLPLPSGPKGSPTLLPNDHTRMLVELLRLAGGTGPELVRRWVAALLSVPADEREAVVEAVEARLLEEYDLPALSGAVSSAEVEPMFHVASPPVPRGGYSEVTIRSYSKAPGKKPARPGAGSGAGKGKLGGGERPRKAASGG